MRFFTSKAKEKVIIQEAIKAHDKTQLSNSINRQMEKYYSAILPWNGKGVIFSGADNKSLITDGYQGNPTVFSIINWITTNAARIPFKVYSGLGTKKKELTDHEISELFNRPNKHQGFAEFMQQVYGFDRITGNAYLWGPRIELGPNRGRFTEMHILPADRVKITGETTIEPVGSYVQNSRLPDDFPVAVVVGVEFDLFDASAGVGITI